MNISLAKTDALNAVLSIKLDSTDYTEKVNKVLTDYRKKARIDGFRPGKVPSGLINKMYRKPVLVEEINKLVSESISNYIIQEKLNILGEPIPHEKEKKLIDWDNDTEFEFELDLGFAPEFEIGLSAKDKVPFYTIKTDDELIKNYTENYTRRFGEMIQVEDITEKDLVKANINQLNADGNVLDGGIQTTESIITPEKIADESIKKQLLKAKKGDSLNINLRKAFPTDADLAGLLHLKQEEVQSIDGNFSISIQEISRFVPSEINQEFFDKAFGEGKVNSEAEFKSKIIEEASKNLKLDSEYRFRIDVKDVLMKKFSGELPKTFLKRWLFLINEGKFTPEQIDQDMDHFIEDLKWQLIKDKLIRENKLETSEEDIKQAAIEYARFQFSQYGMANLPDEHLQEFAQRMLDREEDKKNIVNRATEERIFGFVKSVIKLDEKEITTDKFNKLFEK